MRGWGWEEKAMAAAAAAATADRVEEEDGEACFVRKDERRVESIAR